MFPTEECRVGERDEISAVFIQEGIRVIEHGIMEHLFKIIVSRLT